jgi:hypothetical protein
MTNRRVRIAPSDRMEIAFGGAGVDAAYLVAKRRTSRPADRQRTSTPLTGRCSRGFRRSGTSAPTSSRSSSTASRVDVERRRAAGRFVAALHAAR